MSDCGRLPPDRFPGQQSVSFREVTPIAVLERREVVESRHSLSQRYLSVHFVGTDLRSARPRSTDVQSLVVTFHETAET